MLIADDHSAIRIGVREILKSHFSFLKIGEATCSEEVLDRLQIDDWDILILDIGLPGKNGLEVLLRIQDLGLSVKTLVFTLHSEEQIAIRCLRAGADGFLTKGVEDTELIHALNELLAGRKYFSRSLSNMIANQLVHGSSDPRTALSNREFQVMIALGSGKSNAEIAEQFSLSVSTISTYRRRILHKMNFNNNAAIINYCIQNGLINETPFST